MILIPFFAVVDEDMHRRMAQVIRTAMGRSHGSLGAACIDMDVKQPHLNAAFDGERGLPIGFLSLPVKFWFWLMVGLAEEFGIPKEFDGVFRLFGVMGKPSVARMNGQKEVA